MVRDRVKLSALRLLPKNAVSRAVGGLAEIPLPRALRGAVNRSFAALAGVDVAECERDPSTYRSVNEFFTRGLKHGAREIDAEDVGDLVSPADGRLDQFGPIRENTLVQAKGRTYRLVDLLDSGRDADEFAGGHFATIYLSPRDYHRVHSPAQGIVRRVGYVPGHLWPVNPFAVANVDSLFVVNERLSTFLRNPQLGLVAVVMVGATCVGKMTLAFHPLRTNSAIRRRSDLTLDEPVELEAGGELGVFNLGSTVILLISSSDFEFRDDLEVGQPIRMGERLGSVKNH